MFNLSQKPLERINLTKNFSSKKAGAFSSFEGWVRDHDHGKEVVSLEYEASKTLCQKEAKKIFQEARRNFDILDARCFHRTGRLKVGDMAVWVGAIAPHRDAAFKACQYIIDEIKRRLPIWKKEYFKDGTSQWVNCSCHENKK